MAYKPSKLTLREATDLIKELGGSEDPEAELLRAGECEDITATGLIVSVCGGVPWPEISGSMPPRFWRYTIDWDKNLIQQSPYGTVRLNESEEAREIRIERSGIEAIWGDSDRNDNPQNDAASTSSPIDRRYSASKVTAAYVNRVKTWPENKRHPSRDDDLRWARENFGEGVPRNFVRSLRKDIAPEIWQGAGAPKKYGKK